MYTMMSDMMHEGRNIILTVRTELNVHVTSLVTILVTTEFSRDEMADSSPDILYTCIHIISGKIDEAFWRYSWRYYR